jgi:lysine 6-dehydrogenase
MGRVAAWDLARQPGVTLVRMVDRDPAPLAAAEREVAASIRASSPTRGRAKLETERFDLDDDSGLVRTLSGFDVVLSCADYRFNEALTRAAIEARTHLCDLGGNPSVVQRQLALSELADSARITVIPDCGLAPGMANLLAAWGVERFERADSVRIRVGGLPAHPKPPLNYKLVFAPRGLTNEYLEPAEVLRDGTISHVVPLTEPEPIDFPEPFGRLEAFHCAGGVSTLPTTLAPRVRNIDYKTIRYPGHRAAFAGMAAIGLFDERPIDGVVPRELAEKLIERALTDDDTDVVLVRVTIEGERDGRRARLVLEIVDRHDEKTGHSAMARTTAYPAAAVAYMLGAGAIERRGVLPGEVAVPLDRFVAAVRARGIEITERWEDVC